MATIVLLTGIPGAGKSTFGRWLEDGKGFLHLDVENAKGELSSLSEDWWRVCQGQLSTAGFLSIAGRSTAVDWGFPPTLHQWVRTAIKAGVQGWWFDGDRTRARSAFMQRDTVAMPAFETQMAKIAAYWTQIQASGLRSIEVITSAGHRPPESTYSEMFPPESLR